MSDADPDRTPPPARLVVVTGAPGTGKTTLLQELQRRGFATEGDSARELIARRRRKGLPPRPAPADFACEVYRRDVDRFQRARRRAGTTFFDRCVLDALGLLHEAGVLPRADLALRAGSFRFASPVFVLPPWPAIYEPDAERDQTWADALVVHARVTAWYAGLGHALQEVPPGPVAQRADFLLQALPPLEPQCAGGPFSP